MSDRSGRQDWRRLYDVDGILTIGEPAPLHPDDLQLMLGTQPHQTLRWQPSQANADFSRRHRAEREALVDQGSEYRMGVKTWIHEFRV